MKVSLVAAALLAGAVPALADEPAPRPEEPAPRSDAPPPRPEPAVDPAYGELPQHEEAAASFPAPTGRDIFVPVQGERSRRTVVALAATAGAGALAGAIGLYFHLDSRDAADAVSAKRFTGLEWTPERQENYERAYRSRLRAGIGYGLGGALLLATAIAYIVTDPPTETLIIQPRAPRRRAQALVAPIAGGAFVGGAWSF